MHKIFSIAGPYGTRFNNNLHFSHLSEVLSGIERIRFDMAKPDFGDIIDIAHERAEKATIYFDGNEDPLVIDGPYLWKFLESVPHNLMNEEKTGYANLEYQGQSAEFLVALTRKIYLTLAEPVEELSKKRPPAPTRSIDVFKNGVVNAVQFPEIDQESIESISVILEKQLANDKGKYVKTIFDWVKEILSEPYLEQSYTKQEGSDYLSPQFTPTEWSDVGSLKWEEFLQKLTSKRHSNCPAYMKVDDRWKELSNELFLSLIADTINDNKQSEAIKKLELSSEALGFNGIYGISPLFEVFNRAAEALFDSAMERIKATVH